MKKKALIALIVFAVVVVGLVCLAFSGGLSNNQAPDEGDVDSTAVEEIGVEEGNDVENSSSSGDEQGCVGPDGSGTIDPDDYATDEEYQKALIESGEPEFEVPEEEVSEKQEGESYGHGFVKERIVAYFYTSYGEERAREIVSELGGIWVDDTFAWRSSQEAGRAIVTLYFQGAETREELESICSQLDAYEEVKRASLEIWFEGYDSDDVATMDSMGGYDVNDENAGSQLWLTSGGFRRAWEVVRCSGSVEVAVLDSGIDLDHPDLAANIGTIMSYDAYNRTVLQGAEQDTCGHGTMVSGVISAVANNAIGVAGGSYNAKIIPVRVNKYADKVDPEAVVRAFDYLFALVNKPEVVNMSFSGPKASLGDSYDDIGSRIKTAIDDYKMVCVATSGNSSQIESRYPGAYEGVICVSSIDADREHSETATSGKHISLCAVGEHVFTTTNPEYNDGEFYGAKSGTSFSAPQVAAAAALLKAQHSDWGADKIAQRLELTAIDLGAPGHDELYGYGSLDVAAAVGWKASSSSSSSSPNTGGSAYAMLLKSSL